mgnify:FL=1
MYFSIVPNILYDEKPVKYPFSKSEKTIAKNFFRRYKINEDVFSLAVFFKKYAIEDGETPDMVSMKAYESPFYDWVVILTNNLVNVQYDWPMTNFQINSILDSEYDDPYGTIHHYETAEIGQYPKGLHVDKEFYDKQHKLNINGSIVIKNGNEIASPITVAENMYAENEKKREIFLLKPRYFRDFVEDFKKQNIYKKSGSYIQQRLKETD